MSESAFSFDRRDNPLEAALDYAASGWPVLPCHAVFPNSGGCTCGAEHCASPGKHPTIRGGLRAASRNLDRVRYWWGRWPNANVAIRTGRESRLVVLDVDPAHGGLETLRGLIKEHGSLPQTYTVGTGSDGLHFYFAHPGKQVRNDAGRRLGPGLDIRGDGGYVIAPPSLHGSGHRYHVAADVSIERMPKWILDRLRKPERKREIVMPDTAQMRATRWAEAAMAGELRTLREAPEGSRNSTLNRAAFNLGQIVGAGKLPEVDVSTTLVSAGVAIGLTEREAKATVTSGLKAGVARPRVLKQHGAEVV